MLKDYLVSAQDSLEAKREIFDVKQRRLLLAQDEYNVLNALAASRNSRKWQQLTETANNNLNVKFTLIQIYCFPSTSLQSAPRPTRSAPSMTRSCSRRTWPCQRNGCGD